MKRRDTSHHRLFGSYNGMLRAGDSLEDARDALLASAIVEEIVVRPLSSVFLASFHGLTGMKATLKYQDLLLYEVAAVLVFNHLCFIHGKGAMISLVWLYRFTIPPPYFIPFTRFPCRAIFRPVDKPWDCLRMNSGVLCQQEFTRLSHPERNVVVLMNLSLPLLSSASFTLAAVTFFLGDTVYPPVDLQGRSTFLHPRSFEWALCKASPPREI
ncbi:hypothetical protein NMY22_g15042 [Coprinellus aureogranulatus]|nr:hypothetical protein NMY22_g15042 [Coprinellus aureogranulatus]